MKLNADSYTAGTGYFWFSPPGLSVFALPRLGLDHPTPVIVMRPSQSRNNGKRSDSDMGNGKGIDQEERAVNSSGSAMWGGMMASSGLRMSSSSHHLERS